MGLYAFASAGFLLLLFIAALYSTDAEAAVTCTINTASHPQDTYPYCDLSVGDSAQVTLKDGSTHVVTLNSLSTSHAASGGCGFIHKVTASVTVDGQPATLGVALNQPYTVVNGVKMYALNSNRFAQDSCVNDAGVSADLRILLTEEGLPAIDPSGYHYPIDLLWGLNNHGTRQSNAGRHHDGYDLGYPINTVDVYAIYDGKYYDYGSWTGDFGDNFIGYGTASSQWGEKRATYIHVIQTPEAGVGDLLSAGDKIAVSGSQNWPHIHFQLYGAFGNNEFPFLQETYYATMLNKPKYQGYIKDWLVLGTFDASSNRISTSFFTGEGTVTPAAGETNGGRTWKKWDNLIPGAVDLRNVFSAVPYSNYDRDSFSDDVGYAHTYIYSPTTQAVQFWFGYNDGAKVWLNGNVIFSKDRDHRYDNTLENDILPDEEKIPITLQSGWNRLLIKVSQDTNDVASPLQSWPRAINSPPNSWKFSAKLARDSAGNPVTGLTFATNDPGGSTPDPVEDTTAPTTSSSCNPSSCTSTSSVTVTLSCSDSDSGCAGTQYCIGSSCTPSTTYSGPITRSSTSTIRYRSTDNSGNTETIKSRSVTVNAPTADMPKVLFIGNSLTEYNGHTGKHVQGMAAADGLTFAWDKAHKGGTRLDQHWAEQRGVAQINSGEFDIVVLQPWYWSGGTPETFKQAVRNYDAVIKANGAETWIFEAYPDGGCADPDAFCYYGSHLYQEIIDTSEEIAAEVGGTVVPVLEAWGYNYQNGPEYDLYSVSDSTHPNLKGTYLNSALFYFALSGNSPVGNTYSIPGSDGLVSNPPGDTGAPLTAAEEAALQQVAHAVWTTHTGGGELGPIPLPSTDPPSGLSVEDIPMFVVFGSDDNNIDNGGVAGDNGVKFFTDLMKSRTNPDGSPWRMSFYIMGGSSYDENWEKEQWWDTIQNGNEIGNHHWGPTFPGSYGAWQTEITNTDGVIRQMLLDAGVSPDDARTYHRRGIRTHQDQMSQDAIQAAKDAGYLYHSSHVTGHSGTAGGVTWFPGSMEVEWPGSAFWHDVNYDPIDGMMQIPQHFVRGNYCDTEEIPQTPTAQDSDDYANAVIENIQRSLNDNRAPTHFCVHDFKYNSNRPTNRDAITKIADWISAQQAAGQPIYVVSNSDVYSWMRNPWTLNGAGPISDTTPPAISIISPLTSLPSGTTSTNLQVSTSEVATCRYSTISGQSFTSMSSFDTTGGTTHTEAITGLVNGASQTYYVKCRDSAGNTNPSDKLVAVSVLSAPIAGDFTITINANNIVEDFTPKNRGFATSNWDYIWHGLGVTGGENDQEKVDTVYDVAATLKPGIIRFAGGLWANKVGWDPTGIAPTDGAWTDTVFDGGSYTHAYKPAMVEDFHDLLVATGAEGLVQINACDNNIAMWQDFVQHSVDQGYNFKYYEFGNEQSLEEEWTCLGAANEDEAGVIFANRLVAYSKALKQIDPNIKIMASPIHQPYMYNFDNWLDNSFNIGGSDVDSLAMHHYQLTGSMLGGPSSDSYNSGSVDALLAYDGNVGTNCNSYFGCTSTNPDGGISQFNAWLSRRGIVEKAMEQVNTRYKSSRPEMEIAITEIGPHAIFHQHSINSNHAAAIWLADIMGRWAYNGLDIMTFYTFEDGGNGNSEGSGGGNSRGYFGIWDSTGDIRPIYYTALFYAQYFGDQMVEISTDDPDKLVSGWATLDSNDPDKMKLIVVNYYDTAKTVSLAINGMNVQSGLAWEMTSDNPTDISGHQAFTDHSTKINGIKINDVQWGNSAALLNQLNTIRNSGVAVSNIQNNIVTYQLPAYSVVALELSTTGSSADSIPPMLTSVTPSGTTIIATFNEPLHISASQLSSNYRISSTTDANYATPRTPSSVVLSNDGRSITLTVPQALAAGTVYTLTANDIQDLAGNVKNTQSQSFTTPLTAATRYTTIPGKLEAENYSIGGQNVGYFDTTSTNLGGSTYRNDDVDVESNGEGGLSIGYVEAGEWIQYDIDVQQAGSYLVTARVASAGSGTKTFHLEQNGANITGPISFEPTGGWYNWTTVSVNQVALVSGKQKIRVVMDSSSINLDYLTFQLGAAVPGNKICEAGEETSYPDDCKSFIGSLTDVTTNFNLGILVDGSNNIFQWFTSLLPVQIVENTGSETVSRVTVKLPFQDRLQLLLNGLDIRKQPADSTKGFLIVEGLPDDQVKTVLVDRIANSDRVCIKDATASDISQITPGCNGQDEYLLTCNGVTDANGYTCTIQGQYFNVSGLRN